MKSPIFSFVQVCSFLFVLLFVSCTSGKHLHTMPSSNQYSNIVDSLTQITPYTNIVTEQRFNKSANEVWMENVRNSMDSLCKDSLSLVSQIGIYIYDLTLDKPLFMHHPYQRMRPASCQKLFTAIAALHYLGTDYSIKTSLCTEGEIRNTTLHGDLYIVGAMDPLLTEKEVKEMARKMKERGITNVQGNMYRDMSITDGKPYGWGWCWDDDYGPLSALWVNKKDVFPLVWKKTLKENGIGFQKKDTLTYAPCSTTAKELFSVTHDITSVLHPMMKESDNLCAEALFYHLAYRNMYKKVGRKQAIPLINKVLHQAGGDTIACAMADGSGLSLYNYTTPHSMVCMLRYAYQNPSIFQPLFHSLPIAGVDGTLKKRMKENAAFKKVWAKTGSVRGISSLSGYAQASNGHLLAFSIINQGVLYTADGRNFQDKICHIMCK